MKSKVSIVVTCYNKVKWIGKMLDSVISQNWDNIEVILVNDGSTDGTRDVIAQYELRLIDRGYEVVIVDQENQGVAAAVKHGLIRVTGEYVCMPDCDDLLHEEYVSALVNTLGQYPDINCAVCDGFRKRWDYEYVRNIEDSEITIISNHSKRILKDFLLLRISSPVCLMMIRTSLLEKAHIVERFITDFRSTQEPQIWLPTLLSEDIIIHLNRPLYQSIIRDNSITSSLTELDKIRLFAEDWCMLSIRTLMNYSNYINNIEYYCKLVDIARYNILARFMSRIYLINSIDEGLANQFATAVNESMLLPIVLNTKKIQQAGFFVSYRTICNYLIDYKPENKEILVMLRNTKGRLIAYGAGHAGRYLLPSFLKCNIIPDMVWDVKAHQGDSYFGIPLMQPDFSSLVKEDKVIFLLKGNLDVECELSRVKMFHYQDILDALSLEYFPELN